MRVVVFGIGHPERGDDAVAPTLIRRLRSSTFVSHWWLTLVDDVQLQIEHALDLQLSDLALFIDARNDAPPPFVLREVVTPPGHRITAMARSLEPRDVLHTLSTIGRRPAPPSFVLTVRGEQFDIGAGLSSTANTHLEAAGELLDQLLCTPDADHWRRQLTQTPDRES